ncbi:1D-myo-inositol 2-acetamido-2-deoxy-alpha-D-glucopyranoside deacetylase [Streptomyces glaucescens]
MALDGGGASWQTAAMAAHATQIAVDGDFFVLSNELAQPVFRTEYYELVRGGRSETGLAPAEGRGRAAGREADLFAGIAEEAS